MSLDLLIGDICVMMESQVEDIPKNVATILTARGISVDEELQKALSMKSGGPFSGQAKEELYLVVN